MLVLCHTDTGRAIFFIVNADLNIFCCIIALPFLIDTKGLHQESSGMVDKLPNLVNVRASALTESVRWGEYYIFFLMPNVISWVVPLVSERKILGGIIEGEVIYN